MSYVKNPTPSVGQDLASYIDGELGKIQQAIQELDVSYKLYSAPNKPRDGGIVYADGTNWNPGNGQGLYQYSGSGWSKLNNENKNYIINGNFDIWQRGTSVGSGSGGRMLADRWWVASGGTTNTISQQAFTVGQTDVLNNPVYFIRTAVTSVAGAANYCLMQHHIENVRLSSGKTFTLSFWAKADANRTIAVEGYQTFGSGGTPSAAVLGDVVGYQKFNFTTSWQKFTMTINYPSISGKTIGSNDDSFFGFGFFFDSGSDYSARNGSIGQQSGIYDIAQVQLEEGNVATQFEFRHLQTELGLCQRYYEKSYDLNVSPGSISFVGSSIAYADGLTTGGHTGVINLPFRVTKRKIPVMTYYSPQTGLTGKIYDYTTATDCTVSGSTVGQSTVWVYAANGISNGVNMRVQWTADAEL